MDGLDWLRPDDAFKLLDAANVTDMRLGAPMTFLLYAGPRLSEALRLTWADIDLNAATALLRRTKNGEPIMVHLPPPAVAALANLDKSKRRVFGLTKCARLYALLDKAEKLSASPYRPVAGFICCAIPTRCGGASSPMQTLPPWSHRAYGSPATRRASTSTWTCRLSRGSPTCFRRRHVRRAGSRGRAVLFLATVQSVVGNPTYALTW